MLRGVGERLGAMPRFRRWAAVASAGWAVLVVAYGIGFLSVAAGGQARGTLFLDAMFFLVALVLPLVLAWVAAWLAEELERQREIVAALAEVTAPLVGALAATRQALERQTPATSPEAIHAVVQNAVIGARVDYSVPLDRLLAGQARVEVALQKLTLRRAAAPEPEPPVVEEPPAPPPGWWRSRWWRWRSRRCRSWRRRRRRRGRAGPTWCGRSTFRATPTTRRGSGR